MRSHNIINLLLCFCTCQQIGMKLSLCNIVYFGLQAYYDTRILPANSCQVSKYRPQEIYNVIVCLDKLRK